MKRMKYLKLVCILLLATSVFSCKKDIEITKSVDTKQLYLPNLDIVFEDFNTVDSTKQYQAFANKLFTNNRDLQSSELYVYAAWYYSQAKVMDSSAIMMHLAINHGMSNPNVLSKFGIESDSNFAKVQKRLDSIQSKLKDIENFGIELSSMQEFWSYFNRAKADTSNARSIFKSFIFNGPIELRDYYTIRYNSLDAMKSQMIDNTPEYYTYLETQFSKDSILNLKTQITNWMKHFKTLYNDAVFPKVYVVPGLLNSGGTASEMGMFIGGDMYGKSEQMPTQGMTDWQKDVISETQKLPKLIIHELMHFQQNYGDDKNAQNVLGSIFMEGVCDFMVELATGSVLKNKNTEFLDNPDNLKMVCDDFIKDRYTTDFSKWLYNGEIADRPFDLGYTFGYIISKSYYENHDDKTQAIYNLLNTNDYTSIYKNSEFAFLLD